MLLGSVTDAPVVSLVVDASEVVFFTGRALYGAMGSLYSCPKTGCAGAPTVRRANVLPGALASDGTTAYGSFAGASRMVFRLDSNGTTALDTTLQSVFHITARGGELWLNDFYGGDSSAFSRTILRLIPGTSLQVIGSYAPSSTNTLPTVVTKTHAFLGAHNTSVIVGCALAQCTFAPFTDFDAYVRSMAAPNDDRLFWVTFDGKILSCATGSTCTGASTVMPGTPEVRAITAAAGELVIMTDDALLACDPASCATTIRTVARAPGILRGDPAFATFTADANAYYFVVQSGSDAALRWDIMKVAK